MALTIDSLEIKIQDNAKNSTVGIDALATSLGNLKSVIGDSGGLVASLGNIANALKALSKSGKSFSNGIKALNEATASLDSTRLADFSVQMQGIANGLSHLDGVGKSRISSVVNAIKKIPEITASLDTATIEAFSTSIKKLTEIMTPLAVQMEKITAGFKMLKSPMKTAVSDVKKYAEASSKATKSQQGFLASLVSTITKFGTYYYTISRVTNLLGDLFNESNEYIESLNLFKVAMGDTAEAAQEYAEKVGEIMGIDPAEWMTNQGIFQRMSTGFGISADQAAIMSENLTQLAYDMSSFFNVDVQTAMDKLSSGMSGQIKGLKEWGYNLSVAALQETAFALGIEQSVRTMTEAQKAQLRYITLIMKSNGVMGDMAKTLVTPANAMRVLDAQFTQFKRALGDIVSVLVTRFIPYFQAFVSLMKEAATALATFMGFEIKELDNSNLDMGSDIIDGIGDSADDSVESLKELNKQLAGFDELNILKNNTDSEIPNYDLGIPLPEYDFIGNAFSEYTEIVEKIKGVFAELKEVLKTITEQFEGLDFKTPLVGALSDALEAIKGIVNLIVEVLSPLIEALNIPQLTLDGFELIAEVLETIRKIITSLTPAFKALAEGLAPVFESFGGSVSGDLTNLTGILEKIGDLFVKLAPAFTRIGKSLGSIISKLWQFLEPLTSTGWEGFWSIINGISDVILSLVECLTTLIDLILGDLDEGFGGLSETLAPIRDLLDSIFGTLFGQNSSLLEYIASSLLPNITETLGNLFSNVLVPLCNLISSILAPVLKIISDILTPLWENLLSPIIDSISGSFGSALENIFSILNDKVIPPLQKIISVIDFLWNNLLSPIVNFIVNVFGPIIGDVFTSIGQVVSGIINTFSGIITFITGVFTGDWEKAWDGIVQAFGGVMEVLKGVIKTPINAILGFFERLANGVIDAFNWVKRGINSIGSIRIPDWAIFGEHAGKSLGFNLSMSDHVSIQKLATGGFPSMGQMFIARERGPELVGNIGNKNAVVNNEQIIKGIASGVYSAMIAAQEDGGNSGGGTAKIIVQIGDRAVGEASVRYINGQIVQTGTSPIYN